nr:O-fucosyltransferase 29 [Ipomoea batatas]GMC83113.1 O-fucosyltransferase 29 [Ipomoea batatas]GMC85236.1 O-fucosyltransferase 29 [Ipomoea batatas]GMC87285.1 O-fucosyltransferase 29 [Ipomoea batatas]
MGHKRTIRPNAKRLSALFMKREKMDWDTFASKVKSYQRGFMGEPDEMRPGRGEFHEYPASCICQKPFRYSSARNSSYEYSSDDLSVRNSQKLSNENLRENPASVFDESDHVNPLSD